MNKHFMISRHAPADRYWRGGSGSGAPGVGLGLNIAKRIVEAHGGRIWASTEPGPGLQVSFSLPLAP